MPAGQKVALFFRMLYLFLFILTALWLFLYSFLDIIGIDPSFLVLIGLDPVFDPSLFDFTQVLSIIEYLMLLVQGIIGGLAALTFSILAVLINSVSTVPFISDMANADYLSVFSTIQELSNPSNNFFPHSTIADPATIIEDFGNFLGATTILTLMPITFLSGLGFLKDGDTKLAIYSFLGFQIIIIIAIFTEKILISTSIDSSNIFTMIFSPLFFMGFMLYLLLEIAFQTSYTLNILEPMTEREKRIKKHLKRIRTYVPVSEEAETKAQEAGVKSVQSTKFGLLASSYLREMVERRVFKSGEEVIDSKSMMRLQSYLTNLNQTDPLTDQKLAAKTAQPDTSALIKHFIPTMIIRVIAVVFLSYIIMSPQGIIDVFFARAFPALQQSLELSQPEFRTIAILNITLIFILISVILHYLSSGRTGKVLLRVVQQIDTLVDFERSTKPIQTPGDAGEEEEKEEEGAPTDAEEDIS